MNKIFQLVISVFEGISSAFKWKTKRNKRKDNEEKVDALADYNKFKRK